MAMTDEGSVVDAKKFPKAPQAKSHARAMRKAPTLSERGLWHALRDRRLSGMKWRRQVPLEPYIVDFFCADHRLIVECDGSQHAESARDHVRDDWLRSQGFAIQRFWNHEVINERASVIDTILARCGLPW